MKKKDITAKLENNETLQGYYEVLNKSAEEILRESTDTALCQARKDYEAAKATLYAAQRSVLDADKNYREYEEQVFRHAVIAFSLSMKNKGFLAWIDTNKKYAPDMRLDTLSKSVSYLSELWSNYSDGAKVAKQKVDYRKSLVANIAAMQAKVLEMQAALDELTKEPTQKEANDLK